MEALTEHRAVAQGQSAQGRVHRLPLPPRSAILNQILLLHHYASEADLAADRERVTGDANPFGCLELTDGRSSDTFVQFPFLPPIKPGQYGPIFEVRTYLLKPTGLPPTIAAWTKPRPPA